MTSRSTRVLTAASVVLMVLAGCDAHETDRRYVPLYRFIDPQWRSEAQTNVVGDVPQIASALHTAAYPVMSLFDEARYAIGSSTPTPIFYAPTWKNDPPDKKVIVPLAQDTFPVGTRIAIQPAYSIASVRHRLPAMVATVEKSGETAIVSLDIPPPPEGSGDQVSLNMIGTAVSKETDLHHRLPPVAIPKDAQLEFAIGIQEPAWEQGAVEFQVRGCAEADCQTIFREVLNPAVPAQRTWQPRKVDLAGLAGRTIAFSFETRLLADREDAFSLPAWGNPAVYEPAGERSSDVNVILISIDTLAADHLPTYGYEFPTTPFLDGVLAKEGTVFENLVAAATSTPQSHMSMFTSVQPCEHGVTTGMEEVRPEFVTLAEVLRSAHYVTGAVTEDGWLGYQHGFGHGFNYYAENKSADVMAPDGQVQETLSKARAWIEHNDDKPFFLFLHTFQVHGPYTPPDEYKEMFRQRDGITVDENSPREQRDLVAYDQEIRYTDDQLKAFFEFLDGRGLLENTVLIVTSDHGEEFLEHGEYGHGRNLYEQVTHIPLIVWGPSRIPQGRRDDRLVGHIDLMPTILALAGVPSPPQTTGRNILGAADPSQPEAVFRFTESRAPFALREEFLPVAVNPPSFMARFGNRKMARYREDDGFLYEAYDLDTDPRERSPLPVEAPEFARLKRRLDEYEAACAARLERADEKSREIEMDPERQEKLRALGYLQ